MPVDIIINYRTKALVFTLTFVLAFGMTACSEEGPSGTPAMSVSAQLILEDLIDADRAMETIEILSGPTYDGRLAGTAGNLQAAEYIASEFEKIGLDFPDGMNDYYQFYEQKNVIMQSSSVFEFLSVGGEKSVALTPHVDVRDMVRYPGTLASGERIGEMIHVTDLNEFELYADRLAGRILLINHDLFSPNNPEYVIDKAMKLSPKPAGIFIHHDNRYNDYYMISKYLPEKIMYSDFDNESGPGVFYLTGEGFTKCLEALREGLLLEYSIDYNYETVRVPNVLGVLPASGDDPKGTFMISAHFDHVGTNGDGTYNPGALDNASGTAAMLELARVVAASEMELDYNFLFAAFNGEEESLLGARHYVENPIYPLDTTTLVNLDMVGSTRDRPLNINVDNFAMGSAQKELFETAQSMQIPAIKDFGGASDNMPFEAAGTDAVLLIHMDMTDIHTRRDTPENVSVDRLESVIRLVARWLNEYRID